MDYLIILKSYLVFLAPFVIFIIWFLLFYFIILGGLKIFKITGVSRSKVKIYILVTFLLGLFVEPLTYSVFGSLPNKLVPYFAYLIIASLITFFLLKYYFYLSNKQLLQFFLYLVAVNIIFNLLIFTFQSQEIPRNELQVPGEKMEEELEEKVSETEDILEGTGEKENPCEVWLRGCSKEGYDRCSLGCGTCRECCLGLDLYHLTYPFRTKNNDIICWEAGMTMYKCLNCGDGVCSEHENWCICPEDCEKPTPESLELYPY